MKCVQYAEKPRTGKESDMARNYTAAQTKAIEASGRDLLISAGAGSGKTAVLTERIIRRLTDEANPADITRMLIVTFTKAAAGELRERISGALSDALAKQPKNRRLARQLMALDRAKICTIHSFCLDLLKENGSAAGLPGDFRIADDVEITLLRKSVMNELIDDYYAKNAPEGDIEGFDDFADTFVGTKGDDGLADILLGIENALSSFTEHIDFIKNFARELRCDDRDFALTGCGAEILDLVRGKLLSYRADLESVTSELIDDEKLSKAYLPAFSDDIAFIDRVISATHSGCYSNVAALFENYIPTRLGAVRNIILSESVEKAKKRRTEFHDERRKLSIKFFSLSPQKLAKNRIDTADALTKLYTLLSVFLARFESEKRGRGIVDFGDLERLAYKMLVENGAPTPAAAEISLRFDEIFIDEYQDVNAVQDAIFAAVSNGRNRFMVGDIKQSIYAFRGAEPRIFADYRKKFANLGDEGDKKGAAIFLSDNFRCDCPVIDFSNIVSSCLFTSGRGDIPFTEEDMLIHSKIDTESGEPVRVVLVDGSDCDESEDTEADSDAVSEREAEYVAGEISKLLKGGKKNDGTPIRPGDIAILMRSAKAHSAVFEEVFARYNIPCYNNVTGGFFENAEVLLALCILNIIDNPTKDIYLAGALRSPVFGFTLDELIKIRRASKEGCLYDALRKYCETEDFKKGKDFLDTLELLRSKAVGQPVDRLLWYIYSVTDLPALVYDKENAARRANLMLLYEYARRFEASSFKGLYNFIRYINDILEEKAQLETAKLFGEASDTVKLMTIHQSKGLEFPVCFICGTGKKFNEGDLKRNVVIERSLGISLKLADSTGFARYDTPIRQALVKRLADSQLEEEMRVLYVAMTRARERLYVTALVKNPCELLSAAETDAGALSRYTIMKNSGYMRWILTALEHHKLVSDTPSPAVVEIVSPSPIESADTEGTAKTISDSFEDVDSLRELVRERFDFVYPSTAASRLPAKLSVSKLVPTLLDEDAAELEYEDEPFDFDGKRPRFLDSDKEAPMAVGAERGTATHLFMQFCDFSRFLAFSHDMAKTVEEEAARLSGAGFITRRAASLVDVRRIAAFFKGPVFARICAAKKVWREHRFNVTLPASDFTADIELAKALQNETVLVQGVIDCFFENPDGTLTLIDYKTDFVPSEYSAKEGRAMLLERHRLQLMYYRAALEKISAKKVSDTLIYSFSLGEAFPVE